MPVIREDFGHSFVVCDARLGADLNGYQLRAAPGSFDRFDSILGGKSSHDQRQLTVGCHLNRGSINPLHILRFEDSSAVHFHYKLCIFHSWFATFIEARSVVRSSGAHRRIDQVNLSVSVEFWQGGDEFGRS